MALFETAVNLVCPQVRVFEFFTTPAKVSQVTHPKVSMTFVDPPDRLDHGTQFTLQLAGMGQVQQVVHEVVEYEAPRRFVELAVKTPLKMWRHEHVFEPHGDDGVVVVDRIEFTPPGGMIGFIVTEERILEALRLGFEHQHQRLQELLNGPESA